MDPTGIHRLASSTGSHLRAGATVWNRCEWARCACGIVEWGNQQKLIVARELSRNPAVLVAENPTRGLDIGAAAAIRSRIRAAAEAGAAVLVYSSDLDEVLQLSRSNGGRLSRGTVGGSSDSHTG